MRISNILVRASVSFVTLFSGCSVSTTVVPPIQSGLTPVHFSPQRPESWKLSNGINVLYREDKELPLVQTALYFPRGTLHLPKGADRSQNIVSVSALGALLRAGGTTTKTPDQVDQILEELSASISTSFGAEYGSITGSALRGDTETVLTLMGEILQSPRFDENELNLIKRQSLEHIRRRKDDPDTIAMLGIRQVLYGSRNPYGFISLSSDIKALSVSKVRKVYRDYVRPEGATVTITGDITKEKASELLERVFGGWRASGDPIPADLPVVPDNQATKPTFTFIKGDFTQASVLIAHLGVRRFTPDWPAISVFNEVFGAGGMSSKLFEEVRSKRGLAYAASGGINPGPSRGLNAMYVQTKSSTVGESIDAAIGTLKELQNDTLPDATVADKKRALINSFVFANGSPAATIGRQVLLSLLKYPDRYDETYADTIGAVTSENIRQVASTRWIPSDLAIVVVGDDAALQSFKRSHYVLERKIPVVSYSFGERVNGLR